jgi:hypothetical protein
MNTDKEFVPYQQSLDMKELGFDEPCFKGYTEEYKTLINISNTHTNLSVKNTLPTKPFTAPLYQQAFRWFREKYQLDSSIALVANGYGFYIHKNRNYTNKGESYGMYITYEEAELACLNKLIEIVNNK